MKDVARATSEDDNVCSGLPSQAEDRGERPKNIRRACKRSARREAAFRRDVNHTISKKLVASAIDTLRGIALETLDGIRERAPFRQAQRAQMSGLGLCTAPHALSSTKPDWLECRSPWWTPSIPVSSVVSCGHVARANRRKQAVFSCKQCRYTTNADYNAALNIRSRAKVSWPMVAGRLPQQLLLGLAEPATSCLLSLAVLT